MLNSDCFYRKDTARKTVNQLRQLLQGDVFILRKRSENSKTVLRDVPQEDKDFVADIEFSENKTIKSLGVPWNPVKDRFLDYLMISVLVESLSSLTI